MSILIGRYEFDGPYRSIADLEDKPGLYAVLHFEHDKYELIHVAEAQNIRELIHLSPMTDTSSGGAVLLAACYTPKYGRQERRRMVEEIHNEFDDDGNAENDYVLSTKNSSMPNESEASLSIARTK